jgi:hypothetical protein
MFTLVLASPTMVYGGNAVWPVCPRGAPRSSPSTATIEIDPSRGLGPGPRDEPKEIGPVKTSSRSV